MAGVIVAAPRVAPRSRFRKRMSLALKRGVDLAGAAALLLLTAPVLAVTAISVLVTSGRPVLFRQERIGRHGDRFTMYKFRTMHVGGSDAAHRQLNLRELRGEAVDGHKDATDDRITVVGRWLRRTSLDELPQLVNVIRGEMSLVGPRPALPWEVEHFDDRQRRRERVRPGITGLWQVSGRNDLTMPEMLDLDVRYVSACSTWLDLRILLRTPAVVLSHEGAG